MMQSTRDSSFFIRAFVAIELDDAIQAALRQVQADLKRAPISRIGRWVSPDGIHLTLKFLGDVPSARVDQITGAVERGCHCFAPFEISLGAAGFFPNARRLRVVWIGVDGEVETLMQLQRAIESELNSIGFPPEGRPFQPHLTLGRIRDQARFEEREEMAELIPALRLAAPVSMVAREVSLIRSELRPSGAVYTRLAAAALGKPSA